MSYANTHRPPDPKAMAAATAIQIGIGALVITGLSSGQIPFIDTPKPNPTATFIEQRVPPPPPPEPSAAPEQTTRATTTVHRPETRFELPAIATEIPTTSELPLDDSWFAVPGPAATGTPSAGPIELPKPSPSATFKPIDPAPASPPASWFSTADYPAASIRREEEGTVGYRLRISANGKIENCTVTRSSGHSALDRATCRLLPRRGEFAPARGATGARVKGSYSAEIVWRLP